MIESVELCRRIGTCVSCEACVVECPRGAVTLVRERGLFVPAVDASRCTRCGRCAAVCPGLHLPGEGLGPEDDRMTWAEGPCLGCYTGSVRDNGLRAAAVSGGLVSGLVSAMLRSGDVAEAFVVKAPEGTLREPLRLERVASPAEVASATGSQYLPVSVAYAIRALRAASGPVAIVGTPCELQAVLRSMRAGKIERSSAVLLGLVCDRTFSPRILDHFEATYAKSGERLRRAAFRSKEVGGWPGGLLLEFTSGRRLALGREARTRLKPFLQLRRCVVCADKLNRDADIVFGDCYVPNREDERGSSVMIVRTERGADVVRRHRDALDLRDVPLAEIASSQGLATKVEALDRARVTAEENDLRHGASSDDLRAVRAPAELRQAWGDIAEAEGLDGRGLERRVGASRRERRVAKVTVKAKTALAVLACALRAPSGPDRAAGVGNSVLLVGAGFSNRGAQAMTFAVADGLRALRPELDVYLLSAIDIPGVEERYRMKVLPWDLGTKLALAGLRLGKGGSRRFPAAEESAERVRRAFEDAVAVVDISGFRLSSEWGFNESVDYCLNVLLAKCLRRRYFIFPQSLGPFEYPAWQRPLVTPLIRRALKSAERVCARESSGARDVERVLGAPIECREDIVLTRAALSPDRLYRPGCAPDTVLVPQGTVGIVPSRRVLERQDGMEDIYDAAIRRCIERGRPVRVIAHAAEDASACLALADRYRDTPLVEVLDARLGAYEVEAAIAKMDFLVASRYHAVVHAYRNAVPAVVIGWADKYRELAECVGQERFVFDVRGALAEGDVVAAVDGLLDDPGTERDRIRVGLAGLAEPALMEDVLGVAATGLQPLERGGESAAS